MAGWRGAILALAGLSGLVTLICVSVNMTAWEFDADPLLHHLLPRFLAGHIHNALTMAVAHLSLRGKTDGREESRGEDRGSKTPPLVR